MNETVISDNEIPPWDGALYAANTGHHRALDGWFLSTLPPVAGLEILDLGCGSGDFTRTLADLAGEAGFVVGLDAQPSMVDEALSRAAANQSFVVGTAQDLDRLLPDGEVFDAVHSRSVLHWVPGADHPGVLASTARLLRPGGWARLEFGGAGNIPRMRPLLDDVSASLGGPTSPWWFTDASTYLELAEVAGLTPAADGWVRTVAQRRAFDRESLEGWLHSQCFQAYEVAMPESAHAEFEATVLERLDEARRPDGSFDQTFVRLDALLFKP
jgi:ubiquinone/menaquinone biosynthesis C-methylase UbiE